MGRREPPHTHDLVSLPPYGSNAGAFGLKLVLPLLVGALLLPAGGILGNLSTGQNDRCGSVASPLCVSHGPVGTAARSAVSPLPQTVGTRPPSALLPIPHNSSPSPARWQELHPSVAPQARESEGMAYDAADGYIVLFGGHGSEISSLGSNGVGYCFNDTWIFQNGQWTQLKIPGPPDNCDPSLVYDAADGYVLETMGSYWDAQCGGCLWSTNQTWAFSAGHWRELHIPDPPALDDGSMAYDPQIGGALLCGTYPSPPTGYSTDGEWEFRDGFWSQLHPGPGQAQCGQLADLSYDGAQGVVVALNDSQTAETWTFSNDTWTEGPEFPWLYGDGGALAFDPKDNYSVFIGVVTPYGGSKTEHPNVTMLYEGGQWVNASIPGPPERGQEGLAYDAHDGYLLLFGGCGAGPANNVTACLLNDTWTYSPPPPVLHLALSATPTSICAATSSGCGAGTDATRVTLSVTALPPNATSTSGVDSGQGTVDWGPYPWVDDPTLQFAGWENLVPSPTLNASATCVSGSTGLPFPCASPGPNITGIGTGDPVLSWSWGPPGGANALEVGDTWSVSFNELATGPPYGFDPIDSCSTAPCLQRGESAPFAALTGLSFTPYGNSTRWTDSAPLALVEVLPPQSTPTPVSSTPPPPPPTIGGPQPVAAPALPSPVPIAAPISAVGVSVTAVGGSLSASAAAAGILGAGLARVGIAGRRPTGVAQPVRTGRSSRPRPPIRGSD